MLTPRLQDAGMIGHRKQAPNFATQSIPPSRQWNLLAETIWHSLKMQYV
jgi:hypothetical protein